MSKQLTLSATLSVVAMTVMALVTTLSAPPSGSARDAAAHGVLVSVKGG